MMSEKMGPIISTNGLVFCVDAANPQSIVSGQTIWKDLTFNTTGGTLVNGVGFSGSGITSALSFDGTDDFVRISSDQPFTPTNGFSVTSWVNPTDITFQRYIEITRRQGTSGLPTYLLAFQEYGDIISFGLKTTSTYNELDIQIKSGGTNTWTSYVGTWDGTNKRLYRNGSNIGQNSQIGTISDESGSITNIGSLPNFNSEYFRGRISQVQMYNRGLSPFEVYQNYNAVKGRYGIPDIVTGGLILNLDAGNPYSYNPDNTGSTVWTDVSYTSSGGTLINGSFYTGGTIQFDGVDDYVDCGTASTSTIRNQTQFTLNFWFKKFSSSNDFNLGAFDDSLQKGFFIQWFSDSNIYFGVMNEVRAYNYVNLPYINSWFNFTFVFDGTLVGSTNKAKLYINSTPQSLSNSGTIGSTVPSNTIPLTLGKLTNYSSFGKGNLSITQLYNRALTQTEITQNFNALRGRYGI